MDNITRDDQIIYTELLNILRVLDFKYIIKIPTQIIEFLMNNSLKDENEKFLGYDELGNLKCTEKTKILLNYFFHEYWINENKKENIKSDFNNNLFPKKDNLERRIELNQKSNLIIKENKENLITNIINKIKQIIKLINNKFNRLF